MMKQYLFTFLLSGCIFSLSFSVQAQNYDSHPLEIGVFTGMSTYSGDLKEDFMSYDQSHFTLGVFLSKELYDGFGAELGLNFGKISGADRLSNDPDMKLRNLDFESNIVDAHLLVTYDILHNFRVNTLFKPYVFVGIALFHFDPYTYYKPFGAPKPQKTFLRPYRTEGEGLTAYPDRDLYSLTQFSIPYGIGVKYPISKTIQLGLVLSMRYTFTDYLDDVSQTYIDYHNQQSFNPFSTKIAFRTNELAGHQNDPYPDAGTARGNAQDKDFYFFTGLKISFNLTGINNRIKDYLRQLSCPTY